MRTNMNMYMPIPQPKKIVFYRLPKNKTLKLLLKTLKQQLLINHAQEIEEQEQSPANQEAELFYLWKQAFLSESSLLSILPKD